MQKRLIYADNAATTKLDIDAFEAMKPFLLEDYGNASQLYSFSRTAKSAIKKARETIAVCINAQPEEIYFTSGGTESDNWAIKCAAFSDTKKGAIITSAIEHHAVLHSCTAIERHGYPVAYLMPTVDGLITTETLSNTISNDTCLVSIMLANNEIGTIQPIKELCAIAHAHGVLFHTDAVQAVGHIKIDVKELGVDILSASAHKFNGPKGIGFLYIRNGTSIISYLDGGAQEHNRRAGTENVASIVGMAVALKKNIDFLGANNQHIRHIEHILLSALENTGTGFLRNGGVNTLPGIINLSYAGSDGEAILHRLDLMGIYVSTGSACNSESTEISHVLNALNLDKQLAKGTIRISLGKNNTQDEAIAIANALRKAVGE